MKRATKFYFLLSVFTYVLTFSSVFGNTIIIKNDGTILTCNISNEPLIKIKTITNEYEISPNKIDYIVNKGKNRIRLSGELLKGEIITDKIEVKKGSEDLLISFKDIIFLFNSDTEIDLEQVNQLRIVEFNGRSWLGTFYGKNDKIKEFKIELLLENWRGNIKISNPNYEEIYSKKNMFNYYVGLDIQGDNNSYRDLNKTANILSAEMIFESFGSTTKLRHPLYTFKDILPTSPEDKKSISLYVGSGLNGIYGSGYFYFYIIAHESMVDPAIKNLIILPIVSNILRLPLKIERNVPEGYN